MLRAALHDVKGYAPPPSTAKYVLNANENTYDILSYLDVNVADILAGCRFNRYPDAAAQSLRGAAAAYTGVSADKIIVGNGLDEVIRMVTQAFLDVADRALVLSPTFSEYTSAIKIAGAMPIAVSAGVNFQFNIDDVIQRAQEAAVKLIFLCSPNNPTGQVFSVAEVQRLLDQTDAIIVADEAYFEFCGVSSMALVEQSERLIVLRTLSKAFGLAGLRLGYVVTAAPLMDGLLRVKMPYNVSNLSQAIGAAVLARANQLQPLFDQISTARDALFGQLNQLKGLTVYPSGANFLLIKSALLTEILRALDEQSIAVRSFNTPVLKDCARLTIGRPATNAKVYQVIEEVLSHAIY